MVETSDETRSSRLFSCSHETRYNLYLCHIRTTSSAVSTDDADIFTEPVEETAQEEDSGRVQKSYIEVDKIKLSLTVWAAARWERKHNWVDLATVIEQRVRGNGYRGGLMVFLEVCRVQIFCSKGWGNECCWDVDHVMMLCDFPYRQVLTMGITLAVDHIGTWLQECDVPRNRCSCGALIWTGCCGSICSKRWDFIERMCLL